MNIKRTFEELQAEIARQLIQVGAILTLDNVGHPLLKTREGVHGRETGYELVLHREHPEEPFSPFFFNLRGPDNPGKTGNLTPEIFDLAGQAMAMLIMRNELHCTDLVGVPNAGKPFAQETVKYVFPQPRLLQMRKDGDAIGDFIGDVPESGYPIGIDDLITRAKSKLPVVERARGRGLTMQHFVVLLDRQQGGQEGLAEVGVELHSVFDVRSLLAQAESQKAISTRAYEAALAYLVGR